MNSELEILLITAASIGFFHTIVGPDHYLPFIVMAKSGNWSKTKTVWVTTLCGVGHVLSSVVLGLAGVAFGIAVSKLFHLGN
jgi:nickel/cobalt exporter